MFLFLISGSQILSFPHTGIPTVEYANKGMCRKHYLHMPACSSVCSFLLAIRTGQGQRKSVMCFRHQALFMRSHNLTRWQGQWASSVCGNSHGQAVDMNRMGGAELLSTTQHTSPGAGPMIGGGEGDEWGWRGSVSPSSSYLTWGVQGKS